jgi:hypothetical protein
MPQLANRGTPKGEINGYDLNSSFKVLLIAAAGGALVELIPMVKKSDSPLLAAVGSGALMGLLQLLNRWRRDNTDDRH